MKVGRIAAFVLAVILFGALGATAEERVTIVGWNMESGGADPQREGERIAAFNGIDVWGLCEVSQDWTNTFVTSAETGEDADYASVLGTTGGADRIA